MHFTDILLSSITVIPCTNGDSRLVDRMANGSATLEVCTLGAWEEECDVVESDPQTLCDILGPQPVGKPATVHS